MSPKKARRRTAFDPIDIHVGKRVRLRRKLLDISQTALGHEIGLTFQQLQKYERGANRISASRLYELSQALDTPISYFFEEMPEEIEQKKPAPMPLDPMATREVRELLDAYFGIVDKRTRRALFDMLKTIARTTEPSAKSTENDSP